MKELIPTLHTATLQDYPVIQNMARFYVYDLSRTCGFISSDWACPSDGLYESFDFKNYFEDPSRKAFLIKVKNELAGFVLLNKSGTSSNTEWNMGEFFILAKFQGHGIGYQVAHQLWQRHPGIWEVSVIPENNIALLFWRRAIANYTKHLFSEEIKTIDYDSAQPQRIIFTFNTHQNKSITANTQSLASAAHYNHGEPMKFSLQKIIDDTVTWLTQGDLNTEILAPNFRFNSPYWQDSNREEFINKFKNSTDYKEKALSNIVRFDPLLTFPSPDGKHFSIILQYHTKNHSSVYEALLGFIEDGLLVELRSIYDLNETKKAHDL